MPIGTKVHSAYKSMRKKGYSKGKAARIAQSTTGQSLKTGYKLSNSLKKRVGY